MSKLTNLEQVRAARAFTDAKRIADARQESKEGDQLSGYHSLIITNGLLATFAYSADKGGEHHLIAEALLEHIRALQREKLFPGKCIPVAQLPVSAFIDRKLTERKPDVAKQLQQTVERYIRESGGDVKKAFSRVSQKEKQEQAVLRRMIAAQVLETIKSVSETGDADFLRMMTAECLLYLNYLKRFVRATLV